MRIRLGHGPDDWSLNEPATPIRSRRTYAVIPAVQIPEMQRIVRDGGNYISGGGRPAATAMHVVPEKRS